MMSDTMTGTTSGLGVVTSTASFVTEVLGKTKRRIELMDQREALQAYLLSKVRAGDWHAVQDAGSDIREIDARLDELGRS